MEQSSSGSHGSNNRNPHNLFRWISPTERGIHAAGFERARAHLDRITTAVIDPDGLSFTLARRAWTNTYPLAELPKWIAFYQRQAELVPDQKSYDEDVRALEKLQRG